MTHNIDRISKTLNRMKKNPPSVFQRIFFNLGMINVLKDDTDIIQIKRSNNISENTLKSINLYQKTIEEISPYDINANEPSLLVVDENKKFKESCLEACHLCRSFILKFKILNWITKFFDLCIALSVGLVSEYHIGLNIAIFLVIIGALSISLEMVSDWSKLIEKYAHLHSEFYNLSHSIEENKIETFIDLVSRYESSFLFIDFFNKTESDSKKLKELQNVSFSSLA